MHGAATAHRLNALANSEVAKVDDSSPLSSLENLRGVGVLTKLANESANIALNLLAANKDRVANIEAEEARIASAGDEMTPEEAYRRMLGG